MIRLLAFTGLIFLFGCNSNPSTENNKRTTVEIKDRQIFLNHTSYLIKGVCYNPVPKDSTLRSFSKLSRDITLMKEAGINTIRVYVPIDDKKVLDELYANDIRVIMGFGYNQGGNFDILSGSYIDFIKKYQNHPAILFWELGNEYNYHPEWFNGDIKNWYAALNKAAVQIKKLKTGIPVATAHGELPDSLALALCPDVDIWGMNVYRWDDPSTIFKQWKQISNKPMYLSEAGADSYMTIEKGAYTAGENQKAQADAIQNILDQIATHTDICSGVALFAFSDEWWKAGNPSQQDAGGWAPNSSGVPYDGAPNEEYWGIVTVDGHKKAAFEIVKQIYNQQ